MFWYSVAKNGGRDSLPNLLKIWWLILAVLVITFGIFLSIDDKEKSRNDSTKQDKNCTNEKSAEVRKDNKNRIIIKKKVNKSTKNK